MICILLKSDIVFELNILSIPTHSHCMTLRLCWFHQQVDTCPSIMMELLDPGCSFLLGSYCHLGLSIRGISSSIEALGEVNLPHAASHYYQAFFPALFWVKTVLQDFQYYLWLLIFSACFSSMRHNSKMLQNLCRFINWNLYTICIINKM